jgi:predicted porin
MNKNLLAIAVASALVLPFAANAEVEVFGQAQLEVVSTSGDKTEGLTLGDSSESGTIGSGNASMFGVKGSHDLGNGMTGLYKVNFNFKSDELGAPADRDQYIGLKGAFGTFLMGTMNTPYKSTTVGWDPFLATFMQARGNNGMSKTPGLYNSYGQNVLAYSNKAGDVKYTVGINLDESDNDLPDGGDPDNLPDGDGKRDGDHGFHLGVNAPIGDSLEVAFGLLTESEDSDTVSAAGTATKIGIKWTSGDMSVAAQFETEDEDLTDQDHMYVNFVKGLGNGASAAIAFGSKTDNSAAGNDGTYVAIGYKKSMNKKVSWHAGFVMIDEGIVGANQDVSQVGGGLRVKF